MEMDNQLVVRTALRVKYWDGKNWFAYGRRRGGGGSELHPDCCSCWALLVGLFLNFSLLIFQAKHICVSILQICNFSNISNVVLSDLMNMINAYFLIISWYSFSINYDIIWLISNVIIILRNYKGNITNLIKKYWKIFSYTEKLKQNVEIMK